jgi:predicted RNA binding protein YcfA (HicA-like mRNA interferase family)
LSSAGFLNRGGKGSHRKFKHPRGVCITISGKAGDDAKPYQERAVRKAMEEVSHETQ